MRKLVPVRDIEVVLFGLTGLPPVAVGLSIPPETAEFDTIDSYRSFVAVIIALGYPFLTFFPAVLVTAFLGGWGPGLVAAGLSGALASYFLIEPIHSFSVGGTSGQIGLAFFAAVSATIVALVQSASSAARLLQEANEELERRVAERTRELADAGEALRGEMEQRKAAQDQLRQAQKMEAVGQLTGGIAHDFNNMLAVVIGSLEIARRGAWRSELRALVGSSTARGGRAARAAASPARLLAFSRQQPLAPQVLDVNALVAGMSELLRRTLGEPIQVETSCWRPATCGAARRPGAARERACSTWRSTRATRCRTAARLTIETHNAELDERYARRARRGRSRASTC